MKNLVMAILFLFATGFSTLNAQIINEHGIEIIPLGSDVFHFVGENFTEMGTIGITNTGSLPVELFSISFRNVGNANVNQLANVAMYDVNPWQVSAQTVISNENVQFDLSNGVASGSILNVGDTIIWEIRADVISASIDDTIRFQLAELVTKKQLASGVSTSVLEIEESSSEGMLTKHILDPGFMTAVEPFSSATELSVFPNPTTRFIRISSSEEIKKMNLFDQMGQLVWSGKGNNIDVSAMAKGAYFLKMKMPSGKITTKLIIKD
ncbi:T9SS type A sorting domain-containing protein [bacterium]|jgi:hypothetical protein|nr:T9SS type A sorting domain-containing protein [bacterium]MBT6832353.1 T9SS type A sorting domain-containing protein [bacterium]MBT6996448.1 T9SS type A sorting domain-containing protein [bacterium]MBT7772759.1 T9SS type A sorting domain-containing protein [bacterium]